MKNPLHIILCFLVVACMSTQPARAWQIEKHTDEITDEVRYDVTTVGTPIERGSILSYNPVLIVRITPIKYDATTNRMLYLSEILFAISEVLESGDIILRYDSQDMVRASWTRSTDHRAAFSPNPSDQLKKIAASSVLRIRFANAFGEIQTTKFNTAQLREALQSIKALVAKDPPRLKLDEKTESKLNERLGIPAPAVTSQPETPVADPKLVAQATSAMNDITRALEYAQKPEGMPPRMQTATSLNKPLTDIGRAVSKNISLQNTCQNLEKKFSRSRPGSIGRPTPEQLDRARANAAQSKINLNDAILELRRQARSILQTSDWPTPDLSDQAKAISARIPPQ